MTTPQEQLEHDWQRWLLLVKKGVVKDAEFPRAEELLRQRKLAAQKPKKAKEGEKENVAQTET